MYTILGIMFAVFHLLSMYFCWTTDVLEHKANILILQTLVFVIQMTTLFYIKELKNKNSNNDNNF